MSVENNMEINKVNDTVGNTWSVKEVVTHYPSTTLTAVLLSCYAVPRIFDPNGSQIKRPILKRFFTITLPDNMALAALIMINHIPNLDVLKHPPTLLATLFLMGGISKVVELTRIVAALGADKLSAKTFAEFIGPRDFYAGEAR